LNRTAGTDQRPLRVVFGARSLIPPLTGVGQYAYHLAAGLQKRTDIDLTCFYGTHFSRDIHPGSSAGGAQMRGAARTLIPNAYALRRIVEQVQFGRGVKRQGFDVYHEPNYLAVRFAGPTVITAHDISWIRYPETHPVERVRAMDRYFEPVLRTAAVVLTVSEFVKDEIVSTYGIAPEKVQAILNGLDPIFRPLGATEAAQVLQPLGLQHGRYFLTVGTLEPRKNIESVVRAYTKLPERLRGSYPLVLAGMKGWRTSALEKLLAPLMDSGEARVLGYLDRPQLAGVTAGALTMVYPSLYEGFGLPPLEAMGCGVPPIISTAAALQEVVNDCGLQVEARDVDALAAAMQRMADDPRLRGELAARSLIRARSFTWDRCVEQTLEAYRRAAASSR
jgi:glycosyltransferase involved in cell wall biosynthesis